MSDVQTDRNCIEYYILKMMNASASPLGSGAVCEMLREHGINVSEAGIGRFLRSLRQQKILERVGFQGHIIAECGKQRLAKLEENRDVEDTLRSLLERADSIKKYALLDILVARRALEREAAFQAALNATEEDYEKLKKIIYTQYTVMEKNENYADISTAFHREIINVAKVPLLKNLYELIGLTVQWQDFFIGTFKMYNQPLNVSHEKIFLAIKDKNPEKAANLMWEHLTDVINNAKNLLRDRQRS